MPREGGGVPVKIALCVNGRRVEAAVAPAVRLSAFLRELGLTGLKEGCCEGECGACAVLFDGMPVNSCLVLAFQADGHGVVTVEGLSAGGPSRLQRTLVEFGAVQCGYCMPGMVTAAEGLLGANPAPGEEDIRAALAGNLCRCTGFETIVRAIAAEAAVRQREAMLE